MKKLKIEQTFRFKKRTSSLGIIAIAIGLIHTPIASAALFDYDQLSSVRAELLEFKSPQVLVGNVTTTPTEDLMAGRQELEVTVGDSIIVLENKYSCSMSGVHPANSGSCTSIYSKPWGPAGNLKQIGFECTAKVKAKKTGQPVFGDEQVTIVVSANTPNGIAILTAQERENAFYGGKGLLETQRFQLTRDITKSAYLKPTGTICN